MISFDDSCEWSDPHIAVVTWAQDPDGVRYKCLIRGEALDEAFGQGTSPEDRLRAFRENRAAIEARLQEKISNGRLERSPDNAVAWQVVLLPSDLT